MNKQEISKYANKLYVEMQIDEMLPAEQYEIFVKPDFATASWRFYQGKHQVVIGTDIFTNSAVKMTNITKTKYLRAFLHHEFAHSIWTNKDLKNIVDIVLSEGLSFKIFNLFEDARIEEKMRHHTKKYFDWLIFEQLDTPKNALEIFFYIVQSEHKHNNIIRLKKLVPASQYHELNAVFKFYQKVLDCKSSNEVIQILREWYIHFPDTPRDLPSTEEYVYLFSEEAKSLNNGKYFDELIEGLDNVLIAHDINNPDILHSSSPIASYEVTPSSLLNKKKISIPFDVDLRDMLLDKMEKLFLVPSRNEATQIPSKRLNIKRLASGSDKIFRRKSVQILCKKKITIILDLSGSMGATIENMRLIIDVLDKMASKNIIEGTLILSAVKFRDAKYEILPMPLMENIIERIVPSYQAEGLHNTMSKNIKLLSSSDFVWILTDGFIDEESLDKSYFHRYNIRTHAMYIGDISYKTQMQKSFDYVLCEKNVIDLAHVIFGLVK